MNERLKELRKLLGLSQAEFGEIIFLSQKTVAHMEKKVSKLTKRTLALICEKFDVNEEWLLTGNGEIFKENKQETFEFFKKYDLNDFQKEFFTDFFKLTEAQQSALSTIITSFAQENAMRAKNDNPYSNYTSPPTAPSPQNDFNQHLDEVDRQLEELKQQQFQREKDSKL